MKFLQHFGNSDGCVLFSEQRAKTVYGSQDRTFNLSGIRKHKTEMKIRFSAVPA